MKNNYFYIIFYAIENLFILEVKCKCFIYYLINFSEIKNNAFNIEKINVNNDAKTGNILNHNCAVDIDSLIGKKLPFFFILICNQKIDSG